MTPTHMTAVLLRGHGGFEQLEVSHTVPVPQPGPGQVLVRVHAAALNNTDIATREAWYRGAIAENAGDTLWAGTEMAFPRIQGADAAGTIAQVGPGIDPARIGQRVLVEPAFRIPGAGPFDVQYFGSECDGAFAEYALVPAMHAHAVHTTLTDTELASFPCAYGAAENMLTRAAIRAGETILVTGASGGVGSAAIQLARSRGANVIAIAAPAKAQSLLDLGADRVLLRDADPAATLGRESIDAVIDVAGGPAFPSLLEVLHRGGRYATAGAIAGPHVALDLRRLYLKDLTLYGCTIPGLDVFPNLVRLIESSMIKPLVAATFELRDIFAAQKMFLEKRHTGKIVLRV